MIDRRRLLATAAAMVLASPPAWAARLPAVTVTRRTGCGCCEAWAAIISAAGYSVSMTESDDLDARKAALGVPADLYGCHTSEVAGYVVEGHVPLAAIERLLAERPAAIGIAVPGMPAGSPGMGGAAENYEVTLFTATGRQSFGRYRGEQSVLARRAGKDPSRAVGV